MPLYLAQFAYTSQAWAGLARNPENREAALGALAKKLNARLVGFYYCFGDYDGVALVEAPDDETAAAVVVAASAAGHLRSTKTTRLLTMEEGLAMLHKAGSAVYAPPAGMQSTSA